MLAENADRANQRQTAVIRDVYGLSVGRVVSTGIVDPEGNLAVRREVTGVKVIGSVIFKGIPITERSSGPDPRVIEGPTLASYQFPRPAALVLGRSSESSLRGQVEVEDGLSNGDPPLDFITTLRVVKAFATTRAEAAAAYKGDLFPYERFGEDIFLPVDELVLQLEMPESMAKEVFPVAFYGYSEVKMPTETERIKPFLVRMGSMYRLSIPSPLFGFRYGICWSLEK